MFSQTQVKATSLGHAGQEVFMYNDTESEMQLTLWILLAELSEEQSAL